MAAVTPSTPPHTAALLALARMDKSDLGAALKEITATTSHVLEAARVGVWLFDEHHQSIRCVELYARRTDEHCEGPWLHTSDFPEYFAALESFLVIDAEDAQHDPRTRELTESYLRPLGIRSMLDVPCWRGGRVVGVVCAEHIGPPRRWRPDEQEFAASVADMVSLALEADERRRIARDRERVVEQLDRERNLFEQVLQQMQAGVIVVNRDYQVVLQNTRASAMFGGARIPVDMRNWNYDAIDVPAGMSGLPIARSLAHGELTVGEEVRLVLAGRELWLSVNSGPVRDETGEIVAAVASFTDITEQKRTARALADEGSFRERFMAILGHDLRSPAAAVLLSAQLLQRTGTLDPRQRGLVERIISSGRRMERMITELLDLGRIRTGRFALSCGEVDLLALASDVVSELRSSWPNREIEVTHRGSLAGWWDETRLAQLLTNLVGNALTHGTAERAVSVRLEGRAEEVVLEVVNAGPPLPDEVRRHLFEPFRGGDRARHGPGGGLGLGLYISHAIVSAHGGTITARSGGGETCFTVNLPRRSAS